MEKDFSCVPTLGHLWSIGDPGVFKVTRRALSVSRVLFYLIDPKIDAAYLPGEGHALSVLLHARNTHERGAIMSREPGLLIKS